MPDDFSQQGPLPTDATPAAPPPPPELQTENAPAGELQAPPSPQVPPLVPPPRPPGTSSLGQYQGTKSQIFRSILGDFLYSAGKGMAAAGHGPEANTRGAGEAMGALHERDILNQQLANQRAAIEATAKLKSAQADRLQPATWVDDNGIPHPMSAQDYAMLKGKELTANQRLAGVEDTNQTRKEIATQGNITKIGLKQLEMNIAAQQVSKIVPYKDPNNPNAKPQMMAINKFGKPLGVIEGELPPASMLGKITTRQEIKANAEGGYDFIPVTSTTGPNIGGGTAGGGGGGARPVMMAGGGEMSAPATQQARSRAAAADSVQQIIPRIRELVAQHQDDLGPVMGRGQKVLLKAGAAQGPWVNELNGLLTSLYSFAGTMHGWRALEVERRFKEEYGGLEQSPLNFVGSMDAMEHTANAVINSGTKRIGGGNAATPKGGAAKYSPDNPFAPKK